MKNSKFIRVIALVLCFVLMIAAQSYAAQLRYNESDQKWKNLAPQLVPWRVANKNYIDEDNDYYGTNCFAFVRWVLDDEGRGDIRQYDSTGRVYSSQTGGSLIAQHLRERDGAFTEDTVREKFSQSRAGDVIQMKWRPISQHTVLINGYDDNGVYFFHSHQGGWGVKVITNNYYSYAYLAQRYNNAGAYGGFSIYRFGNPTPVITPGFYMPPEPPDVSQGLINLTSSNYAKIFTCEDTRYYGVYTDQNLTNRRSSSAWTGEDDEIWLLGVGKNSNGIVYAHIKYPVGSYRYEAYMDLKDVFVSGNLKDVKTVKNRHYGLYKRRNSGYDSSYGVDVGATVYKLSEESGWVQILYPTSGSLWRVAWLTDSDYQAMVGDLYAESNFWWNTGRDYVGLRTRENFLNGKVGENYSSKVALNFNSSMYYSRWIMSGSRVEIINGSLPDGLNVRKSGSWYVEIYGTPSKAGTYTFTLRAINGAGGYTDKQFTIVIDSAGVVSYADASMWVRYDYYAAKVGISFWDFVLVYGGTSPYTARIISGSLPTGYSLSVSGNMILITGLTRYYGSFPFTIRITGKHGGYVDKVCNLIVNPNSSYQRAGAGDDVGKPKIITTKLPDATVNNDWSALLETKGTQPITWSYVSGNLPDDFMITESGDIAAFPRTIGNYSFTLKAENSEGSKTKKFKLKVKAEKPLILTKTLPDCVVGLPVDNIILEASGTDPIKWSKSGQFPKGLKINSKTGEITGTPKKAGTYTFTVKAKNKGGKDTAQLQIIVNEPGTSAQDDTFVASFVPVDDNAQDLNDIYVISGDEEFFGDVEIEEGTPLTFGFDEWLDEYGDEVKASDVKVFVNGEEVKDVKISDAGTFTLPAELVKDNFSVYVSAKSGDVEFKTSEVKITAQAQDESVSTGENSSSGCNLGLSGIALMISLAALILKKY